MRKPIDQDAWKCDERRRGEEKRNSKERIEMVTRLKANLLCFALQAGLYRACPRDQANEGQLSRPSGDDPFRERER